VATLVGLLAGLVTLRDGGHFYVGIHGQIDQLDRRQHFLQLPPGIQTIQNGHGNIEYDYVRPQFASNPHQGATIADDSDYIKFGFEKSLTQFCHKIMIVGN
jgi:hypothetical protein